MPVSVRLSELSPITQAQLTDSDLFLVTDSEATSSKKLTLSDFKAHLFSGNSFGSFNDVDLSAGATDGQFLRYNASTQRWNAGDISLSSLGTLSDVDLVTNPPQDGQALVWSSADGKFNPGTFDLSPLYSLIGEGTGETDLGLFVNSPYLEDNKNIRQHLQALSNAIVSETSARNNDVNTFSTSLTTVDTRVTGVDTRVTNVDTRVTGVDTRLQQAEASVSALQVSIAPETLNSISELADALGDDPAAFSTLQTSHATLSTSVTTTQATQDARLDAIEASIRLIQEKLISVDERIEKLFSEDTLLLRLDDDTPPTPNFPATSMFIDEDADSSTTIFEVTLDPQRNVYSLDGVPQPTVQVPRGDIIKFNTSQLSSPSEFRIYRNGAELVQGVSYFGNEVTVDTGSMPTNLNKIFYRNSQTAGMGWIIEVTDI